MIGDRGWRCINKSNANWLGIMRRAVCGAERETTTAVAALESELNKLNFGARARDFRTFGVFFPRLYKQKSRPRRQHTARQQGRKRFISLLPGKVELNLNSIICGYGRQPVVGNDR